MTDNKEHRLQVVTSPRSRLKSSLFLRKLAIASLVLVVFYIFVTLSLLRQACKNIDKIITTTEHNKLDSNFRLATYAAAMTADNDSNDVNSVKKRRQKQQQTIVEKHASSLTKIKPLTSNNPTWLTNYITQHNIATQNGSSLNASHPYLIYTCNQRELCGGIGDRIMGMIKSFYLAVHLKRTLIIDAAYPHPISDFLEPSKMFWNVSFPETTRVVDMLNRKESLRNPKVVGFRLGRCNGVRSRHFYELLKLDEMAKFIPEDSESFESGLIDAFRLAFETLFQFSDVVKKRAAEMMMNVELQRDFQVTTNGVVSPYIGLHHRNGDDAMLKQQQPTTRTTSTTGKWRRQSDKHELLKCYQTIQKVFPGEYQGGGYLASDSDSIKEWMHLQDPSVCYVSDMIIYHVDKSPRENAHTANQNTDHQQNYRGTLDTYAELVNLINADCLIMANSFFSFLAYYIRDPRTSCSVHVEDCDEVSVKQRENLYYYYESSLKLPFFYQKFN